jgi:diguanylate cyclase (GGDEF)-like protein/PAS domain S-box-containing protein
MQTDNKTLSFLKDQNTIFSMISKAEELSIIIDNIVHAVEKQIANVTCLVLLSGENNITSNGGKNINTLEETSLANPIHSTTGKLLGTIQLFFNRYRQLNAHEIDVIDTYIYIAGIAIEGLKTQKSMFHSEEIYQLITEHTSDLISITDKRGLIKYASRSQELLLGFEPNEMIGKYSKDFIKPEDSEQFQKQYRNMLETNKSCRVEFQCLKTDRTWITLEANFVPVLGINGDVENVVIVSRDITKEKQSREIVQLAKAVIDNSPVVLMRWKAESGWPLEYVSANINQFGYSSEELISGSVDYLSLLHPEDRERVNKEIKAFADDKIYNYTQEYRIITKNGLIRWVDDRTTVIVDDKGQRLHSQGIILDITKRKKSEETVLYMANYDALTQLPNRRYFNEQLSSLIVKAKGHKQKLAVLFMDIDNFKEINDLLGNTYGDLLLKELSKRLTSFLPKNCIVARDSGDEFTFILTEITRQSEVDQIVNEILDIFNSSFTIEEHEFIITASIGISLYPNDSTVAETLIKNADMAMYFSKNNGKNNYSYYSTQLNETIVTKRKLEKEIRKALENNQFTLYYQPQFNAQTKKIIGVEALIRWNHPERGIVAPGEFIQIAEDTGLIIPIGEWVLREACKQLKLWQKAGYLSFSIKVNLSARQFQLKNIVSIVSSVLQETQLEPHFLELEMTEYILMQNTKETINTLIQLKQLGLKIAIDDFGKGFSSLNYLKHFPIDTLKIDRSFVWDMLTDYKNEAIVTTIITLAHKLNLNVIAEGVETEEQLNFLKKNQCDEIQGYLLGKPVSPKVFERDFPIN